MIHEKPVFQSLRSGKYINNEHASVIARKCRDEAIKVYMDTRSQLIYLDPHYQGKNESYYVNKHVESFASSRNDMDAIDTQRRSTLLTPLIAGKRWLDFGCGLGYQLRSDSHLSRSSLGLELNAANCKCLSEDDVAVTSDMNAARQFQAQVISMFHVLEHLSDPVEILSQLCQNSIASQTLVIEVPHAKDWLIHNGPESFKQFTFWSEHLVLHTRDSITYLIEESGWQIDHVFGVQRYPLWNHFHWLKHNTPSGYSASSYRQSSMLLNQAYNAYLSDIDQTDTLVAIAKKV